MALYDPIRDGFREFNRMLIDSQQWDEQHEIRAADREYKQTILRGNLVQREFENQMAEKRMFFQEKGDIRADTELGLKVEKQKEDLAVQKKELEFAINTDRRAGVAANERAGRYKAFKETHAAELRSVVAAADTAEIPWVEEPRNVMELFPEHARTNPNLMSKVNELAQSQGAELGSDGFLKVRTEDGLVDLPLSKNAMKKYAPGFMGLLSEFDDPIQNTKTNIESIQAQQGQLKEYANSLAEGYQGGERAAARRQINKLDGEIREKSKIFQPQNAMQVYGKRAKDAYNSSVWLREMGMGDAADSHEELAKEMLENASAMSKQNKGQINDIFKKDLVEGKSVSAGYKAVFNPNSKMWEYVDKEGTLIESPRLPDGDTNREPTEDFISKKDAATVGGSSKQADAAYKWGQESLRKAMSPASDVMDTFADQKAGIDYAERLMAKMADIQVNDKDGNVIGTLAPKNNKDATRLRDLVQKKYRQNHNDAYQDYLVAQKSRNPERLAEWRQSALDEFGYLPIKPFVDQIWMGTSKLRGEK